MTACRNTSNGIARRFRSAFARALPLAAACTLPTFGILFYGPGAPAERIDAAQTALRARAEATAAALDAEIRGATLMLRTLVRIPALDAATCRPLVDLLGPLQRFHGGHAVRPDGIIACSSEPAAAGASLADRGYFRRALASDKVEVGEPEVGRSPGRYGVPLALALRDTAGRVVSYWRSTHPAWFSGARRPRTERGVSMVWDSWPASRSPGLNRWTCSARRSPTIRSAGTCLRDPAGTSAPEAPTAGTGRVRLRHYSRNR